MCYWFPGRRTEFSELGVCCAVEKSGETDKVHYRPESQCGGCRGEFFVSCQGLGVLLVQHLIDYARRELGYVDLHLTSSPHRVAANRLYQKLGFEKRETNAYEMRVREGEL